MSTAVVPASTEQLFNAAVDVIRDLPKNGSYQPSYGLMLRFYGFYKQATQGPCYQTKPAFWDVVGRAKWEAWNKLGNMSKEEAMEQYIEELKKQISEMVTQHRDETAKKCVGGVSPEEREKIVETMSYTENIEKFMDVLGPFYEFLDMEAPDKKQLTNGDSDNGILINGSGDAQLLEKGHIMRKSKEILSEKYASDSDSENDEYADPIEVQVEDIKVLKKIVTDHNDNDSGFADQVEFARSHNFQNGNVQQFNGVVNRDWIPYVNGESDSSCESPPLETSDVKTGTSVKGLVARGGGDEDGANGNGGPIGQRRGNQSADNRRQTGYRETLNQPNLGLFERQSAGVGGNGRGGPGRDQHLPDNISEQIAVALLRLQRDMDSVLARLNVLETVALAQHNTVHERFGAHLPMQRDLQAANKHSRHWWPFKEMSFRSFLFFLTWPVIVHVIFKILAIRRARRRLRNC